MSKPSAKAVYSFVVDSDPRFANQARVFLTTLLATGVPSTDIVAHVTPNVGNEARTLIDSFGVRQVCLQPVLDKAYCNKIAQYDALDETDADFIVLCDTDLAFLDNLRSLFDEETVRGKPVDMPNPPAEVLEQVRLALGIAAQPRLIPTDGEPFAQTYSTNCNGGLYIIPRRLFPRISRHILGVTRAISDRIDLLGKWSIHLDQVGFAMTMLQLGLDVRAIPPEYNFPMHLPKILRPAVGSPPKVLHYHWLADDRGSLKLIDDPVVDQAIKAVNRILI